MNLSVKKPCFVELERGFLRLGGEEVAKFLQGLVTNDVEKVSEGNSIYSALLTSEGRYLHDFLIHKWGGDFLLEGSKDRMEDLRKRLMIYKLRAKVTIQVVEGFRAYSLFNIIQQPKIEGSLIVMDPRIKEAGVHVVSQKDLSGDFDALGIVPMSLDEYEEYRLELGLPDGEKDIVIEKGILLECGFDELHGIDFDKGCYLGQELNVRTKFRGKVRKRLLPLVLRQGHMPEYDSEIMHDGKKIGKLRSAKQHNALGMVRIEGLTKVDFPFEVKVGESVMEVRCPDWVHL